LAVVVAVAALLLTTVWSAPSASAQGNAEIEIENLTKLAGTDIGYPADDYYSFNRVKNANPAPGEAFQVTQTHDTNTMRISNPGSDPLVITAITITDTDVNQAQPSYELPNGEDQNLPLTIAPGGSYDLDIGFIAIDGGGKRLIKDKIEITSNAGNAPTLTATLHGIYMVNPREGAEIDLQSIISVFGFQTSMNGNVRPRELVPTVADVESGVHGDLVVAELWQQADVSQPVHAMMLAAFNGQQSGVRLIDEFDKTITVGSPGVGMRSSRHFEQSLFPRAELDTAFEDAVYPAGDVDHAITYRTAQTILDDNGDRRPFRIIMNNNSTTAWPTRSSNPELDPALGVRVYRAIDRNGYEIPNTYITAQDFVRFGCKVAGVNEHPEAGNCDWQDTVMVFTNIEPINPILSPYTNPDDFSCDANEGAVTWTDAVKSKYWVYKSTDGGATYNWLGRTAGSPAAATFTDPAPSVGATYQVHFAGIDRVTCTVSAEPTASAAPFACDSNGGVLSWTDAGEAKYWVYNSVDGGATYNWLGRTAGAPAATTFTDPAPSIGTTYQVHYQGIDRAECTISAEPTPSALPFACESDLGAVSWTDAGEGKYWVYKSVDGGVTYNWLGRTIGAPAATTLADPSPTAGALYQVHYQGIPRSYCTLIN